jgi:hypothetical protein
VNTPFDLGQYGATLVGPEEPPWYAPVYWASCAMMFIALLIPQPNRSVVRLEEKR